MKLEPLKAAQLGDLLPFVTEYHAFEGIDMPEAARRAAVAGLLSDPRLGEILAVVEDGAWVGYIALTYGYSIEFQGRDAFVDEFFIRAPHRGRGLGSRALEAVKTRLAGVGVRVLHLEVARDNAVARAAYSRLGFQARDRFSLMSVELEGQGPAERG